MKCFSGNENWSQEWQDKMNDMGHQASLQLIYEYPEFNLCELSHSQKGYDVMTRNYDIFIETKRRDRADVVDITKPQYDLSTIISMYDENMIGFHCYTEEYIKYAELTSYYKKNGTGKYVRMSKNKFKEISTENLGELLLPMMEVLQRKATMDDFL